MKRVISYFRNFIVNVFVFLLGILVRRDKKIVLFGAWMGNRFADNSRYLYQYMFSHKDELDLKRVVWVTRNINVYNEMKEFGYEVYMMRSRESVYWHLKAGVHIVCNMYCKTGIHLGDIIGYLSCGARKVQLWHGIGIKACGNLVSKTVNNHNKVMTALKKAIFSKHTLGATIFSAGCWGNRYHLVTSDISAWIAINDYGVKEDRLIYSTYPRLYDETDLLLSEKNVLDELLLHTNGKKIVLYAPTFREMSEKDSQYKDPLSFKIFIDFLKENNIIWIEKRHSASQFHSSHVNLSNVYYLDPNFDINLVYKYIDVLVTDYSSAASDCIYRFKEVISFIPDISQYVESERGFVTNYKDFYPGDMVYDIDSLMHVLQRNDNMLDEDVRDKYRKTKTFLFKEQDVDLKSISNKVCGRC